MAGVTYLIRMLPLVLFKKEITSPFVKSFFILCALCLSGSNDLSAILTAPSSGMIAGAARIAAYRKKSLLTGSSLRPAWRAVFAARTDSWISGII